MIYYIIIISIFLYYILNYYFKKHFWYKVYKQLNITDHFYTDKEFRVLQIYQNFNEKNKHKMVPIPIFDLKKNEII